MYVYESHLGGFYASDEYLEPDSLYCEECGDSDYYVGYASTKKEAIELLKTYYKEESYNEILEIVESF